MPRTTLLVLAGLSLACLAAPAPGQNVLDADLYVKQSPLPGGVNPVAPQEDFRARNNLITNNVLGGRGFRGTVGYAAEYDFRETTGSDDLFLFRAGSGWSDVTLVNYGNTFNRLRFGQNIGLIEFDREASGVSLNRLPGVGVSSLTSGQRTEKIIQLDQVSYNSSLVASGLQAADMVDVGMVRDMETGEPLIVAASPLGGLQTIEPALDFRRVGITGWDLARLREDAEKGLLAQQPAEQFQLKLLERLNDTRVANPVLSARPEVLAQDNRVRGLDGPGYQEILERIAERYALETGVEAERATEPGQLQRLDDDLEAMRRRFGGTAGDDPTADEPIEPAPEGGFEPAETPNLDLSEVLRHGQQIEQFSGGDPTRFNELVREAEQHLAAGEYFRSETSFKRALRFEPGHPLATAGLVHAQIGAGLYLPASMTLRSLYTFQPEMIDVRYARKLVPNRPRLNRAVEELQRRMGESRSQADLAFLLAYVGRLLGDEALVEQGLTVLGNVAPDDPLLEVVGRVWRGEKATEKPVAEPDTP